MNDDGNDITPGENEQKPPRATWRLVWAALRLLLFGVTVVVKWLAGVFPPSMVIFVVTALRIGYVLGIDRGRFDLPLDLVILLCGMAVLFLVGMFGYAAETAQNVKNQELFRIIVFGIALLLSFAPVGQSW